MRKGEGVKIFVSTRDLLSLKRSSPRSKRLLEIVLTLAIAHLLQSRLVSQRILAGLDDKGETGGDRLGRLCRLGLLGGGHYE